MLLQYFAILACRPFLFISLRDSHGVTQLTFATEDEESNAISSSEQQRLFDLAGALKLESSISVRGIVARRPEGMSNSAMGTGEVEVAVQDLVVLNEALTVPLKIGTEDVLPNEETRLRHRHIDLRREMLQYNLRMRSAVTRAARYCADIDH